MSDHPALVLVVPSSFPMDIPTREPSQPTIQKETSHSSPLTYTPHDILTPQRPSQSYPRITPDEAYPAPAPQRSPKWEMFRRSFAWTTPRRNKAHEDEASSPKTLSTKSNQGEAFEMVETERHDAHTALKPPSPVNSLHSSAQARKRKTQEPHPGRRIDVGDCDEEGEGDDLAVEDEDDAWMVSVREYHLFLRSSRTAVTGRGNHVVGDLVTPAGPVISGVAVKGKGESVNSGLANSRLQPHILHQPSQHEPSFPQASSPQTSPLTIPIPLTDFLSPPLARENSNASTESSSSMASFISHVRESFAFRGSRGFLESRNGPEYRVFEDEDGTEGGWAWCGGGVLESSGEGGCGSRVLEGVMSCD